MNTNEHNTEDEIGEPMWCVEANVVYERSYGPGGVEKRSGSKHFAPGAKVYVVDLYTGGARVKVVGRHRVSHRYITTVVRSEWLVNWRAALIYSPHIISQILEKTETLVVNDQHQIVKGFRKSIYFLGHGSDEQQKKVAEGIAEIGQNRTQPFVKRPPSNET